MKKPHIKDIYTVSDLESWTPEHTPLRLGVIGDPVDHSLSPTIQNAALDEAKIEMRYGRFHVRPDELEKALLLTRDLGFVGVNLTVPHKLRAMGCVEEIQGDAKQAGAINTIAFEGGKSIGFNTDGHGFSRAIREQFAVDLRDVRVLVLGAGGAGRAIALQCAKEGCERLVVANRTLARAAELVAGLRQFFVGPRVLGPVPRLQVISWDEAAIQAQIANIDLVVNATPIGLRASDVSPIPARLLAPHLLVYDTVYQREQTLTPFTKAATEAGARAANGKSMLLYQGARAFEIWFGRVAPLAAMRAALV